MIFVYLHGIILLYKFTERKCESVIQFYYGNGCINFIMSLNSENISAEVVTPRGNIFLANIGIHNPQKSYMNPGAAQGGSVYMNPGAAGTNSVYMNPAGQYTSPGVQQGTVFFSAVSSVPGQVGFMDLDNM